MKKLMIALAALSLAGSAQATAWTFNVDANFPIKDGYKAATVGGKSTDSLRAGYSAYVISYSDGTSFYAEYGTTQSAFLTNLRSGKTVADAAGAALIGETTTTANGLVNALTVANLNENFYRHTGDEEIDTVYAFMAVVVGDDIYISDEGYSVRFNADLSFTAENSDTRRDVDGTVPFDDSDSVASRGWYSLVSSVPEPTSGLLMLLGMAGLALRRKRA